MPGEERAREGDAKRDTAQGIPRRSLSAVRTLPNQAYVASSDGIAYFPGGMTVSRTMSSKSYI